MNEQEGRIFKYIARREARGVSRTPRRDLVNRFQAELPIPELDDILNRMVNQHLVYRAEMNIRRDGRGGKSTVFYKTADAPSSNSFEPRRGPALSYKRMIEKDLVPDNRICRKHMYAIASLLRYRKQRINEPNKFISERTLIPSIRSAWIRDDQSAGDPTPEQIREALRDLVEFGHAEMRVRSYDGKPDVPFYRINPQEYI